MIDWINSLSDVKISNSDKKDIEDDVKDIISDNKNEISKKVKEIPQEFVGYNYINSSSYNTPLNVGDAKVGELTWTCNSLILSGTTINSI